MWRQTSKVLQKQPRLVSTRVEGFPRHQHQLMVSSTPEEQLRESRRVFLLSLQDIVTAFPKLATAAKSTGARIVIPESMPSISMLDSPVVDENVSTEESSLRRDRNKFVANEPRANREFGVKKEMSRTEKLRNAIRNEDATCAAELVTQALESKETLATPRTSVQLFYLLIGSNPMLAFEVLKEYRSSVTLTGIELGMYLKLCSSVGSIEPRFKQRGAMKSFVTELIEDVLSMDKNAKEQLLPRIITGLASQKNVRIGFYAKDLYWYLVNHDCEIRPGWLKKLLSLSRYNRQDDLPYDDIMERLAQTTTLPHPLWVISAVHNMFPFTDSDKMCRTLRALLHFQRRNALENFPMHSRADEIYIDIDCLELISSGAAKTGSVEMVSLVWDILMQCNYKPTESIYENTIIAFASEGGHLRSAFWAIVSMKEAGFEVHRSLFRSFSLVRR
jgi:hypothetical protein